MYWKYVKKGKAVGGTVHKEYKEVERQLIDKMRAVLPKYDIDIKHNLILSNAYCGDGFRLLDKKSLFNRKLRVDSYDINSAYPSALKENEYPLSGKFKYHSSKDKDFKEEVKKWRDGCKLLHVKLKGMPHKKWKGKEYDTYIKNFFKQVNEYEMSGWISNKGMIFFKEMYEMKGSISIDAIIEYVEVGKLNSKLIDILEKFKKEKDKQTGEAKDQYKIIYNKNIYGKFALKHGKKMRDNLVIIAIFQTDYVKLKMLEVLKGVEDKVIYIDTDGVKLKAGTKFKGAIGNELGEFKKEFENARMDLYRMRGYWIYNDNGEIAEQCISGVHHKFSVEEIERLYKGETIRLNDERYYVDKKGKSHNVGLDINIYNTLNVDIGKI